ncbi:PQQ-dependent sugar dehydrogenase [Xanthomonas citri]|uniref:PQQ-dependent sugar dehydrogenase n=1 Tax=Xanthomonas citri TaxID=346 RepID=UPI0002C3F8EB|nr:sorbosone dehydrogenase family protein [Xanthomonas citri]AGI10149.1 L-sorbosone dehydrogenase [Xanthomonas citri subsp. citri Aw12879]AJZ46437.1 Glucose/sorbosone dehydrogenase [Xanthomonas citri pv. citri]AJZ51057.1 Glucose/sorbosone dehydrogenase [Xanthomonas citri pv. citri]AJZ55678.1 Glucose/sorbosone dehydrogenase [Xanthomonas citri pv. citri]AJZ68468.1 Glucose/sorbosone dehydrogenase [Xanthomonas citri pv. citri]
MNASRLKFARWPLSLMALAVLAACGDTATLAIEQGTGPDPQLPEPVKRLIPTVKVAPVKRWAANAKPIAADDLKVAAFARDLDHPRWIYVLPNGDVLVAETAEPPKPEDAEAGGGLRKKVQGAMMKKAGAAVASANRITLLRDADGDGVAEVRTQFVSGLFSPFGMALIGDRFYVANADAMVSFPYKAGDTHLTAKPAFVANLPGGINHHWTKSLLASPDGSKLYVGVGSNSNVAENGMEAELNRAAILEIDPATGSSRVFAGGLRNPVGTAWEPQSKSLWVVVNERDEIGSDLVPDYLTSVRDGGFYGWPYSYYGQHVDERVKPQNPQLVAEAIKPDYALGPHTASLGLSFASGTLLPERFRQGAFIGQHGSWNRDPPSGYKVLFVPFADGKPNGPPITVLDGFLDAEGNAQGRPVGVASDSRGALLVADDVGNVIWRVTPKAR